MLRSEHTICSEASMPSAPKQACHLLRTEHTICSKNKKDMTTNNNKRQLSARLLAVALTICLYGCSGEITDGNTLPAGKYPMTFTAAVDGLMQTRATTDNTWEGGEEIAVRIDDEVKKYVAATDNTLSVENDGTPWYWQNTIETKTVSAWYPHCTTKLADNALTVKADQRDDGYQASDYLEAAETMVTFGNRALTFKHRTAKVVVTLKAGNGVSAGDLNGATVRFLNLTGVEDGGTEVTSKFDNNTYSALLIPQQIQGDKFIQVTAGGNTYYYTPAGSDTEFAGGKQYPYEITVTKNGLAVTAGGVTEWGSGSETKVTSKILESGFAPSDLKIGDYYYSDGTWSDGGYRKYTDNSTALLPVMPVLTSADGKERTVIGIVYWVGDIKGDNYGLLDSKFPDGTRGLVVSLWDMPAPDNSNSTTMTWTYGSHEYVNTWLGSQNDVTCTWIDRPSSFSSIQEENRMQGYANTVALAEYNKYVEDSNNSKNQNLRVKPVKGLAAFQSAHPAPASSSGWYWPSVYELKQVCRGQGVTSQGTNGKTMLNTQIGKVSGTTFGGYYWSSTENSNGSYYAWYVDFSDGNVGNRGKDDRTYPVRPLFAF